MNIEILLFYNCFLTFASFLTISKLTSLDQKLIPRKSLKLQCSRQLQTIETKNNGLVVLIQE